MSIKCEYCYINNDDLNLLTLPCGFNVCLKHFDYVSDQFDCFMCHEHIVNKNKCFKMAKNRFKLSEINYLKHVDLIKLKLKEVKILQNDPNYYLNELTSRVINKIDIRREKLKLEICKEIDSYVDELLKYINDYKLENEKLIESIDMNTRDIEESFNVDSSGMNAKQKSCLYDEKMLLLKNKEKLILDPIMDIIEKINKLDFKEGLPFDYFRIKSIFGQVLFEKWEETLQNDFSSSYFDYYSDSNLSNVTESTYE